MVKEVRLEVSYEIDNQGFDRLETLVVSRYSEYEDLIYVKFGTLEAILDKEEVKSKFEGFLD